MLNKSSFKKIVSKYKSKKGMILIISAPTASGKTTVCRELMRLNKNIIRSISVTTRSPRAGEKNGEDYYFVSKEIFLSLRLKIILVAL